MAEPGPKIRVVIADDHPIFRDGLRRLLEADGRFAVVGEASDGREAVAQAAALRPDVLLLDLAMPRSSGLRALAELAEAGSPTRTVLLTAAIEPAETRRALRLGARGVILKDSATQLLFTCLQAVMDGKLWIGQEPASVVLEHFRSSDTDPPPALTLTPRELQVVAAVVGGASNKEVARQFNVTEQTVKNHLLSIFDKVGVSNRLELALYTAHHRLLDALSDDEDEPNR
jgi:two-component system, NarL family, nitrate/nitrite response regulator NarL